MKVRFAIFGAGRFGRHYIRIISASENAELVAVAVGNLGSVDKIKQELDLDGMVNITIDYLSVLRDPSIDAVIIATPAGSHASMVKESLLHGKHVLVEKPAALSVKDMMEIKNLVVASGKIFMVGHQYVYNDYIKYFKDVLSNGELGLPLYIFAEHFYFTPIRHDVGCFWETATHEMSIIDYLFDGKIEISKISGKATDFTGGKRDDFAVTSFELQQGILATVVVSWISPIRSRKFVIGCEKGTIVFDDRADNKLIIFTTPFLGNLKRDQMSSITVDLEKEQIVIPEIIFREPLKLQIDAFLKSIIEGKKPITGIDHGLRVTKMLDDIYGKIGI